MVTLVWGAWALQSVLGTFLSPQFRMGMSQMRAVRKAKRMENHTIICGYGRIGRAVAAELARNGEQFVILEHDESLVEGLRENGWHIVQGDATEDLALLAAGVAKAKRLLAVLQHDNANIVTVLSARELNPNSEISSRVVDADAEHKLRRAGADEVVSPYDFGGRRLALTALRPHVAEFLTQVVFDEGRGAEMDEIPVLPGSNWSIVTWARRICGGISALWSSLCIILVRRSIIRSSGFELNPGSDTVLHEGDVLMVVGHSEQLARVHQALGACDRLMILIIRVPILPPTRR